jgi:hypothetical protein
MSLLQKRLGADIKPMKTKNFGGRRGRVEEDEVGGGMN